MTEWDIRYVGVTDGVWMGTDESDGDIVDLAPIYSGSAGRVRAARLFVKRPDSAGLQVVLPLSAIHALVVAGLRQLGSAAGDRVQAEALIALLPEVKP